MPGMLSADDIEQLEQSEGDEFDRLFLSFMIEHHEGALEMVDNLLDQQGAAQDPVLYAFTSDVTSDQGAEIDRMDAMLAGFSPDPRVNLAPGFRDAGEASLNVQLLVSLPKPEGFCMIRITHQECPTVRRVRRYSSLKMLLMPR